MNTQTETVGQHIWRDVSNGWGGFACTRCGLGQYEADGLGCRGVRAYACPTQSNAFTHGTCLTQYGSSRDAQLHWQAAHSLAAQSSRAA